MFTFPLFCLVFHIRRWASLQSIPVLFTVVSPANKTVPGILQRLKYLLNEWMNEHMSDVLHSKQGSMWERAVIWLSRMCWKTKFWYKGLNQCQNIVLECLIYCPNSSSSLRKTVSFTCILWNNSNETYLIYILVGRTSRPCQSPFSSPTSLLTCPFPLLWPISPSAS